MSTLAPNSYLRDAILTATAEQLQLMLYDGAIRFARQGRDALEARDFEKSYEKLSRAQAIIAEMENGLRPEVNPELCSRMASIYGFLYRKLVDASVNRDSKAIDDALKVLYIERDTWVMLIEKVNQVRAAGASAPHGQPPAEQGGLSVEG
jgi:flagellar protein FliS